MVLRFRTFKNTLIPKNIYKSLTVISGVSFIYVAQNDLQGLRYLLDIHAPTWQFGVFFFSYKKIDNLKI